MIPVKEPEDIGALVNALDKLVPMGLEAEASVIRDKLGLPDPEDDAELLESRPRPLPWRRPADRPKIPSKPRTAPSAQRPKKKIAPAETATSAPWRRRSTPPRIPSSPSRSARSWSGRCWRRRARTRRRCSDGWPRSIRRVHPRAPGEARPRAGRGERLGTHQRRRGPLMPGPVDLGYLFGLPPAEALAYFRAKGFRISDSWLDVWQEEHARVFTIARMAQQDLLEETREFIDRALSEGIPTEKAAASSKSTWPTPAGGARKRSSARTGRARGPARHAPPRAHDPADEHQYGLRRRALPPSGGDGRGASLLALQRDPRRLDAALAPRARRQGVPGRRPHLDRIYPPNGFAAAAGCARSRNARRAAKASRC